MNRTATRILPVLALSAVVVGSVSAGTAVAAELITGAQIKNGSVTGLDVKDSSLTGKDVKNGSFGEGELSPGTRNKLNKPAVVGYQVVTTTVSVPTAGQASAYAFCPAGKIALGGGGSWADAGLETDAVLNESGPGQQIGEFFAPVGAGDVADAWEVTGQHNNLDPVALTAYVICVSPS